ncbi:hypothetical protein WJX74_007823 [Apatococcus lobatus]|uniref:RRM domain-containing protein n=1 Tax=Apatococcus lobatus TaxID=904363 RepID=A0AAW1Q6M3_9CHLO
MRGAPEEIPAGSHHANVEGWTQPRNPEAPTTHRAEARSSAALAGNTSCDLRHQDANESMLKSFEDLLRAGGPLMRRASLEGSRRSFSEYPLRPLGNYPERDARSELPLNPSTSTSDGSDIVAALSPSAEQIPTMSAEGIRLHQTPPSAEWARQELRAAAGESMSSQPGRRLLMESPEEAEYSKDIQDRLQGQLREQRLLQQQQQMQMQQGPLLSHRSQPGSQPHHEAGQGLQQQSQPQQQGANLQYMEPHDPSLQQYKQMYPHPQQLAALLQQQQQQGNVHPHAAPAADPGHGSGSIRVPEQRPVAGHDAGNPAPYPNQLPFQYAQPDYQHEQLHAAQHQANLSASQFPGQVSNQPGQHMQRQQLSNNPLSPRMDPLRTHSNLSTFSSLGHEAAMDTVRYSASVLNSMGSSGYSSGYGSRHQAGGAPMSGIMSTAQSLLSTSQSMSGMMWSGGGLMSTGQSSGAWEDNEGRELARDLAGLQQAQGVSGVSLLDRVHLPPLIESCGPTSGMRPPVSNARSHASLGLAGRKRYTTQQHPFARTHSVDSALPNPELLDTPPRGGLFATSSGMPSLLETDDSQGYQATWQVWIGNVLPDVSRHNILAFLDRFGPVQDVVTFPGHSYAIASFLDEASAAQAVASLHEQQVPLISGQSRLMLSLRDERGSFTADMEGRSIPSSHSPERMLHQDFTARLGSSGERHPPSRQGEWEGATVPSSRIWLGNIAATATQRCVRQIFGKFGQLTDAAVFPARIGPLGYAFVNFEQVGHAMRAYDMLNNAVVPLLTGNKQLKMRFKPAKENEPGPSGVPSLSHAMSSGIDLPAHELLPSGTGMSARTLILGNVSLKPNRAAIEIAFGSYGLLEAVRTFPGKPYAIVHFFQPQHAAQAAASLDGVPVASISGHRPLLVRLQSALQAAAIQGMQSDAGASAFQGSQGGRPIPHTFTSPVTPTWDASLSAGSSPTMGAWPGMAGPSHLSSLQTAGLELAEMPLPAVNLSNRLNPNNVHFDTALAARYKRMGKAEKEALWAADRLQQQQANLANLDAHGLQAESAGGSLESQLGRLRQELLLAQQQAAAIGGSSGSTSLPADLVQRAALLLNPNAQLSPLAQSLLGGLLEQQPQAQQLPNSQQLLDQQAAQILSSLGSTDLASLLNRRDRAMPLQVGPDIAGLGNQQVLIEQQHQQPQQATPEQWRYLHQEQQQNAAGAPQPSFPQARPATGPSEVQQQQQPLTVLQMSRQGSRGDSKAAGISGFGNMQAGSAVPLPSQDTSRLPPRQAADRMPHHMMASELPPVPAGWRQPDAVGAPTGQSLQPPSTQPLQHQQQLADLRRALAANPY